MYEIKKVDMIPAIKQKPLFLYNFIKLTKAPEILSYYLWIQRFNDFCEILKIFAFFHRSAMMNVGHLQLYDK